MIRVQLSRDNTVLGEQKVLGSKAADQVLDRFITEIHIGKYGEGRFTLDADCLDRHGIFVGVYFKSSVTTLEKV